MKLYSRRLYLVLVLLHLDRSFRDDLRGIGQLKPQTVALCLDTCLALDFRQSVLHFLHQRLKLAVLHDCFARWAL